MNTSNNNPCVVICHKSDEIAKDIQFVMQRDHRAAAGRANSPADFRLVRNVSNPVKIFVIDQSIEPREAEAIWIDAAIDPSILVVVCARTGKDQVRIGDTDRRIVTAPGADSTEILEAIEKLRITRGRKAKEAFEAGVIWLEPATGRVRVHNRDIKVSGPEFQLLEILATQPFRTFPKDELAMRIEGTRSVSRGQVRQVEKVAHQLHRTLAGAHLEAVIEPAGIGFQLFPGSFQKRHTEPVMMRQAA